MQRLHDFLVPVLRKSDGTGNQNVSDWIRRQKVPNCLLSIAAWWDSQREGRVQGRFKNKTKS